MCIRDRLYAGVMALPEKQAKRIYARYYLGMRVSEIVAAEGVDPSRILSLIHISTVQSLDAYLDTVSGRAVSIRAEVKPKEQRMKEINTLLSHIANFEAHKPVHVAVSYTHLDVYKRQIIDTQTWERVQELRKQRKRPNRYDEVGLFSGMLFCADCGLRISDEPLQRKRDREPWNRKRADHQRADRTGCQSSRI